MNAVRRKQLSALQDRIIALQSDYADLIAECEAIAADVETLRDEEQEAFDNLGENLQQGERGQAMEQAVSDMESALENLSAITDLDPSALDSAVSSLDDAKGVA